MVHLNQQKLKKSDNSKHCKDKKPLGTSSRDDGSVSRYNCREEQSGARSETWKYIKPPSQCLPS